MDIIQNFKPHNCCGFNITSKYKSHSRYNQFGNECLDNLSKLLQAKVTEIGLIARATMDADLDHLVFEIEQIFKQMIRENSHLFNQLKAIAKTFKTDNSILKQKIRDQLEANRDLKSELRLLRQNNRQKVEDLKLEMHLKNEEINQLSEKDNNGIVYWKEKYHNQEKEHDRIRNEFQSQVLQYCQKDTEFIQMKHFSSQVESKLKEEVYSLRLSNQNLQTELSKSYDSIRKYDQECQHNQLILKAAREHVVKLLDRHKQDIDSNHIQGYYMFDSLCSPHINGSGDCINETSYLQKVLSIVSEGKSLEHNGSKYLERSRFITITPTNFATTNYNNNYLSSSNCQFSNSQTAHNYFDENVYPLKYTGDYLNSFERSQFNSDVSSTTSKQSLDFSFTKSKENDLKESIDRSYMLTYTPTESLGDVRASYDLWSSSLQKGKMSSASSVLSVVSSLQSTDDQEFRNGLQNLDSKISRLQSKLHSK